MLEITDRSSARRRRFRDSGTAPTSSHVVRSCPWFNYCHAMRQSRIAGPQMANCIRSFKNWIKRRLHSLFVVGQPLWLRHPATALLFQHPNIMELRRNKSWRLPRSMAGIAGSDLDELLAFVRECCVVVSTRPPRRAYLRACLPSQRGDRLWRG